jgi:hypothetical protein
MCAQVWPNAAYGDLLTFWLLGRLRDRVAR